MLEPTKRVAHTINVLLALASVAGVFVYGLNTAGRSFGPLMFALSVLLPVVLPYALVFYAIRSATSFLTSFIALGTVFICAAFSAMVYRESYTVIDPKHFIAIWFVVVSQLTVAGIALVVIHICRPKKRPSNMAVVSDAPADAMLDQAYDSARRTPPR